MNPLLREIKEPGPVGCGDGRCGCDGTVPCVTSADIAHGAAENVRPPLGVMPREIWIEKRKADLARAITDYVNAGRLEPVGEWVEELRQLCSILKS